MKKILAFALLLTAGFFLSSCISSDEEEYFSDYFVIGDLKFGINSAKYKEAGGLTVTLYSEKLFVKVFLSPSLVGKTVDLATLGRSETDYWIITTNEGKADSRELINGKPRSDSGTITVNLDSSSKRLTVDMDCILGRSYGIEAHYNGKAEPDMQDIIIDQ